MLERGPALETEPNIGPHIVDNIGIRRGTGMIDIYPNPQAIRGFILSLAEKIRPDLLPQASQTVDRLSISLGARGLLEVTMGVLERELKRGGSPDAVIRARKALEVGKFVLFSLGGTAIGGEYFPDSEEPLLYLNFGNPLIALKEFGKKFTHEAVHFIQYLEAQPERNIPKDLLGFVASFLAIDAVLGAGMGAAVEATGIHNKKKPLVSRREFLKIVARSMPQMMMYTTTPAVMLQYIIRYSFFEPHETDAFKDAAIYAPNEADFDQMFHIIERNGT